MVRRLRSFSRFAFVVVLTLTGCAESIYLSSRPPGADVTINGQPAGRTPLTYSVLPANWHPPYRFRAEHPGYAPVEGTLATGVSDGRVVGGIFSLGLSLFFKQPETFVDQEYSFELRPIAERGGARPIERRPRPEPRPPTLPYDPPSGTDPWRDDRLPPPPAPPPSAPARVLPPPPPLATPRPTPSPARVVPPPSPTPVPLPPPESLEPAAPAPGAPELPPAEPPPDVQAELERLRKLRDEGVIIDAEYEQLRESVLKGQ